MAEVRQDLFSIDAYRFDLPEDLIAQHPLKDRASARMMVVDRSRETISHFLFRDFPDFVNPGDVIVVNDSRVIHARLHLRKATGGRVDVLVLEVKDGDLRVYLERGKKVREGLQLIHEASGITFKVVGIENQRFLRLEPSEPLTTEDVDRLGSMPLPPYIKREASREDEEYYQTVYASEKGSIAAPTAGLHFTEEILRAIEEKGARVVSVTLHVSIGTFVPLKSKDIRDHYVHPEYFRVPRETAKAVNAARAEGKRVFCIGTTSVRTVETVAKGGFLTPAEGYTDLYIMPGFKFQITDALLTNFHLPASSLIVLVCAFGGYELIMKAYREAVKHRYRFYSYGDCMLIL